MSTQSYIPFGENEYWEDRYSKDLDHFEWYIYFVDYEQEIAKYLHHSKKILMVGQGNSKMGDDFYQRNLKQVTCIDISKSVVEQMSLKYPNIPYLLMDVKELSFENNYFDLVFDKACLDCLFCGKHAFMSVDRALEQIHRVLKKEGYYFLLSNSPASLRQSFLEKYFKVTLIPVEKWWERHIIYDKDKELPKYLFLYQCQKI